MPYVSAILIHNSFSTKILFAMFLSYFPHKTEIKQVTSHYRACHSDKDVFILTSIIQKMFLQLKTALKIPDKLL